MVWVHVVSVEPCTHSPRQWRCVWQVWTSGSPQGPAASSARSWADGTRRAETLGLVGAADTKDRRRRRRTGEEGRQAALQLLTLLVDFQVSSTNMSVCVWLGGGVRACVCAHITPRNVIGRLTSHHMTPWQMSAERVLVSPRAVNTRSGSCRHWVLHCWKLVTSHGDRTHTRMSPCTSLTTGLP